MNTHVNTERLLERFLDYVRIDTSANPDTTDYPSSQGQLELGRLLVRELKDMGANDVEQDEHGLVWATIPATVPGEIPTILLNAHLDTSPEAPGANIRPQVIRDYAGGDIPLPTADRSICQSDCPELSDLQGHCLVTTDGSTLLGGDDKAGVATIMELGQHLIENPSLPHGTVRILFTCDEEIGRGASRMDLQKAAAAAAYTLDGSGNGTVENENFSADSMLVRALGHNIHPAIAKDRMINATRAMAAFIARLPTEEHSPETTDGKQGFIHPYEVRGGVASAECKILLRDFDTESLDQFESIIREAVQDTETTTPGVSFQLERSAQYRNMADSLRHSPQVVQFALDAFGNLGRPCRTGSIRGGTDGAVFSAMGLPTPNLSVGQHNIHSVLEFASITEMQWAVEHLIALLAHWQAHARS